MANNKLSDLKDHLFDTIEGLKNGTIDVEKGRAIAGVGQTIINAAKVEVDYLRLTGFAGKSEFVEPNPPQSILPPAVNAPKIKQLTAKR